MLPTGSKIRSDFGLQVGYGRGGIRTHGTLLTYTHFPGVRLKPLGHPSCILFGGNTNTDRERFELSIPGSPVCRFSRPVPSTTRPPVLERRKLSAYRHFFNPISSRATTRFRHRRASRMTRFLDS